MNSDTYGPRPRLAILTFADLPRLYLEEETLPAALADAGVEAVPVAWDKLASAGRFDAVLFRSTWDYFLRMPEFRVFLDELEQAGTRCINALPLVRWNLDKVYLTELAKRGVPIVPTHYVRHDPVNLAEVLDSHGWQRAVIKPAVSGGAFRTHLFTREQASEHDAEASALSAESGLLVQPYLPEIERDGEWSLLFFEGEFSHAVVKLPNDLDFRVQLQHGGTFRAATPPEDVLARARQVLASLPVAPLYARVDGVVLESGFHLMEVELIEPYLYFAAAPETMATFAGAVARALKASA